MSVSCTAVSGAITVSSWLEVPFDPLDAVTPTTWKFAPLTWIVCPTGSDPPNNSLTTVGPSTTTRVCFWTSALVNQEPSAIV